MCCEAMSHIFRNPIKDDYEIHSPEVTQRLSPPSLNAFFYLKAKNIK